MPLPIDISALLAGSLVESERVELKEGWNPESVLHTLCAFANDFHNLGGGYVIVGVAEKDGHAQLPPAGLTPEQIDAIQKEVLNLGHSAIQPFYHPVLEPAVVEGRHILIAIHGHEIIELVATHPGGIRLGQLMEIVGERYGRHVTFHRTTEIQIACTMLDPEKMSASNIGAIYQNRWKVGLFIDDLKTMLGMAVLKTLSPAMIRRELLAHIIAYNLLRALMNHGKSAEAESASFKGTIDRLNHWLPIVLNAPSARLRKRLVTDLTELVAEDQVPSRPFRREPRAAKRRPKPHQLLNVPRHQMIENSHRTRYKKTTDEIIPNDP